MGRKRWSSQASHAQCHDPRQAFDPAVVGVDEKIFQGAYQVNELATGWFPQVVLVNVSGLYQTNESCCAYSQTEPQP